MCVSEDVTELKGLGMLGRGQSESRVRTCGGLGVLMSLLRTEGEKRG